MNHPTAPTSAHRNGCPRSGGGSRPAVVVSDLDGTLLNAQGALAPRTLTALRAAADAGTALVFATARPAWSAAALLHGARGLGAHLVSSNGAVVSDLDTSRTTRVRAMTPQQARTVVDGLPPGAAWALDRTDDRLLGPGWPDGLSSGNGSAAAPAPRTVAEVPDDGGGILCLMIQNLAEEPAFGPRDGLLWTSSSPGLIEVSAPGADKVSAVESVLAALPGPPAWKDVLAFGDSPNDAGLLAAAGTGVAVANARPEVLALADATAPHHDQDGVAQWLEGACLCPARQTAAAPATA